MAYRTFRNEPYYDRPEIDVFPKTIALLQVAEQARQRERLQNKALAASYKADKLTSKFNADQEKLNYLSEANTQNAVADIRRYGFITPQTRDSLSRAMGYKQLSDAQWQMKEDLEKSINDRVIRGPKPEKNYYNKAYDEQRLVDASYGKHDDPNDQVDYNNRADRLHQFANTIGTDYIHGFNKEAYLNDYVDEYKNAYIKNSDTDKSGVKSSTKTTAIFWDKNGVPKVTDDHAIEYLNSSPDIKEHYKQVVDLDLVDDLRKMAARGVKWAQETDPESGVKMLREHPELNEENKTLPGERERSLALKDLERQQRVSLDNSHDYSKYRDESGLGINNKNVTHSYTYHEGDLSGPGGVMPLKTGKNFTIATTSPDRADVYSGKTSHGMRGKIDLSVEGYQLVPVTSDNSVLPIKTGSIQEFIQSINNLPYSYADPSKPGAVTDMKVALRGTSIDKAKLIQKSRFAEKDLNNQIAAARQALDYDKAQSLEQQRDMIKQVNKFMEKDELTEQEESQLQSILPYIGIEGIEHNELVVANTQDLATVKSVTGGFDLSDRNRWSPEMKQAQQAFQQWKDRAKANGYKDTPEQKKVKGKKYEQNVKEISGSTKKPSTGASQQLPMVASDEDYKKIPPGGTYQHMDENGNVITRIKPK